MAIIDLIACVANIFNISQVPFLGSYPLIPRIFTSIAQVFIIYNLFSKATKPLKQRRVWDRFIKLFIFVVVCLDIALLFYNELRLAQQR